MRTVGKLFHKPFVAALTGGLVVAAVGWAGLALGVIDADGDHDPATQTPLTEAGGSSGGMSVGEIYKRDSAGVVHIESERTQATVPGPFNLFPEQQRSTATGSGMVVDKDGYILTNAHVVQGADRVQVTMDPDGKPIRAEVVGTDPSTDLALLRVSVPSDKLHPLQFGASDKVQVGDPVVAIGNPFGLDRTVTAGIVSALQRQIEAPDGFNIIDVIQTDAAINPGNSGGPLIDGSGRVVGINSQIATGGGNGSVGIGFAVPVSTVSQVVDRLRNGEHVEHAYLGITGADLDPSLARALDLPVRRGVLVQEVFAGGPAARAGIVGGSTQATVGSTEAMIGGDILVEIDGKQIDGMDDVVEIVGRAKPGDRVEIKLLRNREERTVTVTLGQRPDQIQDSQTP